MDYFQTTDADELQPRTFESVKIWIDRVICTLGSGTHKICGNKFLKHSVHDIDGKSPKHVEYVYIHTVFEYDGVYVNFAPKCVCDTKEYANHIFSESYVPGIVTITMTCDSVNVYDLSNIIPYKSEWTPVPVPDPELRKRQKRQKLHSGQVIDIPEQKVIDNPEQKVIDNPEQKVIDNPEQKVIDIPEQKVIDNPEQKVIDIPEQKGIWPREQRRIARQKNRKRKLEHYQKCADSFADADTNNATRAVLMPRDSLVIFRARDFKYRPRDFKYDKVCVKIVKGVCNKDDIIKHIYTDYSRYYGNDIRGGYIKCLDGEKALSAFNLACEKNLVSGTNCMYEMDINDALLCVKIVTKSKRVFRFKLPDYDYEIEHENEKEEMVSDNPVDHNLIDSATPVDSDSATPVDSDSATPVDSDSATPVDSDS
jgi:hypothetical protein